MYVFFIYYYISFSQQSLYGVISQDFYAAGVFGSHKFVYRHIVYNKAMDTERRYVDGGGMTLLAKILPRIYLKIFSKLFLIRTSYSNLESLRVTQSLLSLSSRS